MHWLCDPGVCGERYPYSTSDVEMVGEGNYWKLPRVQPSIMHYKDPPQAR